MKPFKFLHVADTHLGLEQYNSQERFKDFNRAFREVFKRALEEDVDFVILAGDMFEKSMVTPATLTALHTVMTEFKADCEKKLKKTVPVIAIQGNHDIGYSYGSKRSWMDFLAELGLIFLLDAERDNIKEKLAFPKLVPPSTKGGFLEIGDARVHGVRYLGTNTPKFLSAIRDAIEVVDGKVNILVMHMGISGQDEDEYGVDLSDVALKALKDKVDYLAIGHYHKQYKLPTDDPWIYNPGSTEVTSGKEIFKPVDRGVFIVEFHDKGIKSVRAVNFANGIPVTKGELPNRRFVKIALSVEHEGISTFDDTLALILDHPALRFLKKAAPDSAINISDLNIPVLFLLLDGSVPYSMMDFNTRKIKEELERNLAVVLVRVNSFVRSKTEDISVEGGEGRTISSIERETFEALIENLDVYKAKKKDIAALMIEIKQALNEQKPDMKVLKDNIKEFYITNLSKVTGTVFDAHKHEIVKIIPEHSQHDENVPAQDKAEEGVSKQSKPKKEKDPLADDIDFDEEFYENYDDGLGEDKKP